MPGYTTGHLDACQKLTRAIWFPILLPLICQKLTLCEQYNSELKPIRKPAVLCYCLRIVCCVVFFYFFNNFAKDVKIVTFSTTDGVSVWL